MLKHVDIIEASDITVKYNGYIGEGYGYSNLSKRTMNEYLKVGNIYKVKFICFNYDCVDGNNYYSFYGEKGLNHWFPCKSFDVIAKKDLMMEKYDLK